MVKTYIENVKKLIDDFYSGILVESTIEEAHKIREINDKIVHLLWDEEDKLEDEYF